MNEGYAYHETIDRAAEGLTLLQYLRQRYDHSSPAEWAERIAAGQVLVNGQAVHAESVLRPGCEMVWHRPPWAEPDAPGSFAILYEDDDLIAVNKPAGLPTLPGANFLWSTLLSLLRAYAPDAAPLHRLGRWTSGIVLCAKTRHARTELMRQWSAKVVGKRYRALANGCPGWDQKTISAPIGPVPHALLGSVHAASQEGKVSLSYVTVIERRAASFLCDVRIATGRPHQIRIHLAASGHPLEGDPLYGAGGLPVPGTRALPGDPGYHLHAAELDFHHPRTGRAVVIACEPPPLLRVSEGSRSPT